MMMLLPASNTSRQQQAAAQLAHQKAQQKQIYRIDKEEQLRRRRGVVDLTWIGGGGGDEDGDNSEKSFASLRADGSVQLWERRRHHRHHHHHHHHHDSSSKAKKAAYHYRPIVAAELRDVFSTSTTTGAEEESSSASSSSRPLSLSMLGSSSNGNNDVSRLCATNGSGRVAVLACGDTTTKHHSSSLSVVDQFDAFDVGSKQRDRSKLEDQYYPVVSATCVHSRNNWIALGGKDRETVLFDIASQKQIWKAKNLPPNPQTLLQPLVWPTSILFLNETDSASIAGGSNNVMVVGTAHQQIRVYDVRVAAGSSSSTSSAVVSHHQQQPKRRPILSTPEGDVVQHRVTALCELDPYRIAVGDSAGYLYSIDLRTLNKPTATNMITSSAASTKGKSNPARFVGPAGSVRQLVKHRTLPRMAAVGLDRMLRIYDTNTRKQLHCVYLKQRLNCVLMCGDDEGGEEDDGVEGARNDGGDGDSDRGMDQDDVVKDYVDSDDDANVVEDGEGGDYEDEDEINRAGVGGDEDENDDSDSEEESGSEDDERNDPPRKRAKC